MATASASEERVKQGFPAIRLVGWASPPFYDRAEHKLHWAKELAFGDCSAAHAELRRAGARPQRRAEDQFCGRHGPARRDQGRHPGRHGMPEFVVGSRYQDYVPGAESRLAAYGIGGLIAGKVLSKAGLLALALAS